MQGSRLQFLFKLNSSENIFHRDAPFVSCSLSAAFEHVGFSEAFGRNPYISDHRLTERDLWINDNALMPC